MLFHYRASDKNGKIIEGDYETDSSPQVLQFLATKNFRPISVSALKVGKVPSRKIFGGINLTDKVFLTKYLALMLKVGTDLLAAIDILIADFDKIAMKNLLLEIRENLNSGQPFYTTFKKYPKIFSSVFSSLIEAGEKSGRLEQTFTELSASTEKEAALRSEIKSALTYPLILLVIAFVILLFLVSFALPKVADVFLSTGVQPPLFSRVVFTIGLFINANMAAFLIILFGSIAFLYYFFVKNLIGQKVLTQIINHLPVARHLAHDIAIQRFASTLSALIEAGLPIIESIKITADAVGNQEFKMALTRIADEGLSKGLTIGEAFKREEVFPNVVSNLIAISEKAGHLEEVLKTLADFYANNIDASIKTLVAFLEPIMLMLMGGMVAIIALSIIVPIYQLTSHI